MRALCFILPLLVLVGCSGSTPTSRPARTAPAALPTTTEAFVELAARGQTDAILAAIRAGFDPNTAAPIEGTFDDAITPLMAAAWRDRAETVRALLRAGADVSMVDGKGNAALRWAADGHAPQAARALIEAGADLSNRNAEGTSATGWAASSGATDVLAVLLDAGADVNERDANGYTPLHSAIKTYGETYGGTETVTFLLARGADPNARTTDGVTPLHRAASDTPGAFAVSALLLDAGANPATRDGRGRTPAALATERNAARLAALYAGDATARAQADLYIAIAKGDAAGVREAIGAGADPNAGTQGNDFFAADFIDDGGPVHLAARVGSPAVLAALATGGADLDAVTSSGQPPIKVAADVGRLDAVQALLTAGASPESTDARPFLGMEPVHWAATGGHAAIVRALLDAGADPGYSTNATMGYGYNALGFAIHHGHLGVVRVLLDAGMTTEHVGENPATALDLAEARGWPEIAALLRSRGAQTAADLGAERAAADVAEGGPEAAWERAIQDGDPNRMRALLVVGHAPPADALLNALFSLQDAPDLVGALVAAGVDVDATGYAGNSALHEAAANGLGDLVSALLDAGADPLLPNEEGQTPLDLALEWGDDEVIALFTVGPGDE